MPKIVAEKSQWIRLGFQLFAEHGMSGVVVGKMTEKLKCNRSSFYWHFTSKAEFVNHIVENWIEKDTNQIISLIDKEEVPEKKFRVLVEVVFKKDPYIDFVFHLKRYALKRKDIQPIIDENDDRRLEYVMVLLEDLGYNKKQCLIKSQIFYKYLIGYHEMIRYKKQNKNYVEEVFEEMSHFIKIRQ